MDLRLQMNEQLRNLLLKTYQMKRVDIIPELGEMVVHTRTFTPFVRTLEL